PAQQGRGKSMNGLSGERICGGGDDGFENGGRAGHLGRRPAELGGVGSGRQSNREFLAVGGLLVVLGDTFANLGGGDPDNRIGGGIVVGVPPEDLNAQGAFFDVFRAARERGFYDQA